MKRLRFGLVVWVLIFGFGLTGCSNESEPQGPDRSEAGSAGKEGYPFATSAFEQGAAEDMREIQMELEVSAPYPFLTAVVHSFTSTGESLGVQSHRVAGYSGIVPVTLSVRGSERFVEVAVRANEVRYLTADVGSLDCRATLEARDYFEPVPIRCSLRTTAEHVLSHKISRDAQNGDKNPFSYRTVRTWKKLSEHLSNPVTSELAPLIAASHLYIGKKAEANLHSEHAPQFDKTLEIADVLLDSFMVAQTIDSIRFNDAIRQALGMTSITPASDLLGDRENPIVEAVDGMPPDAAIFLRLFLEGNSQISLSTEARQTAHQVTIDDRSGRIEWTPMPWVKGYHVYVDEFLVAATDDYFVEAAIPTTAKQVKLTAVSAAGELAPLILNRRNDNSMATSMGVR